MLSGLNIFSRLAALERRVKALEAESAAGIWAAEPEDTAAAMRGAQMEALLRYDGTERREGEA